MIPRLQSRLAPDALSALTFSPLAWLKLQMFCHSGCTEIGGFGVSADDDPLYVEDFVTVRQQVTPVTVRIDDAAVADWFDRCVDQGLTRSRCGRIWLHTHPGASVTPSSTDEETFARVFGRCDWAVMLILGGTGQTYARLAFSAGPGGDLPLPVQVDWSAWAVTMSAPGGTLEARLEQWRQEYAANIEVVPDLSFPSFGSPVGLLGYSADRGPAGPARQRRAASPDRGGYGQGAARGRSADHRRPAPPAGTRPPLG
jgi:hypothetical protein